MPTLYNAYEAKLLNVLHSKLVKKIIPCLLSDPLIQGLQFLKENSLVIRGDLPFFIFLKKIGLFSRATCSHTLKHGLFSGATYPHTHAGLFSRATCPFEWVNLRSHMAISFNPKQSRCVTRST